MTPPGATETFVHEHVAVSRLERVLILRIAREDKFGASPGRMLEALHAQVSSIRRDTSIGAFILTGTGRSFVAGAYIAQCRGDAQSSFGSFQHGSRALFDAIEALRSRRLPQSTGTPAVEPSSWHSRAISSSRPIPRRSRCPRSRSDCLRAGEGPSACPGWPEPSGRRRFLTGRTVSAEERRERDVATAIVTADTLQSAAQSFASTLASLPHEALREAKRLIDDGTRQERASALTADQAALSRLFVLHDGIQGVAAFMEKRQPRLRFPAAERAAPHVTRLNEKEA